jgi:hypothetical protein
VGVHQDVQVTSSNWGRDPLRRQHHITQVFGSACAIAYSSNATEMWRPVAELILQASYEATLHAALQTAYRHGGADGSRIVFLTALGGGVFGNDMGWIARAIGMACSKFRHTNLDVRILQYSHPVERPLLELIESFNQTPEAKHRHDCVPPLTEAVLPRMPESVAAEESASQQAVSLSHLGACPGCNNPRRSSVTAVPSSDHEGRP